MSANPHARADARRYVAIVLAIATAGTAAWIWLLS